MKLSNQRKSGCYSSLLHDVFDKVNHYFSIANSERQKQLAESSAAKLEKELGTLKNDRAEQSKLIKKFQRKLLLVTKVSI